MVSGTRDPADLTFLEDLMIEYVRPWCTSTAVHQLAEVIMDEMFLFDRNGPYVEHVDEAGRRRRYLPVDVLMQSHRIRDGEMFTVPEPFGQNVRSISRVRPGDDRKDPIVEACHAHYIGLSDSEDYRELTEYLCDEVFRIIFPNRLLLARIHELLAPRVAALPVDHLREAPGAGIFVLPDGSIRRMTPPEHFLRAVFFRDLGRCVHCERRVEGIFESVMPMANFEFMVSPDEGGLQDYTNLQLVCGNCKPTPPEQYVPRLFSV